MKDVRNRQECAKMNRSKSYVIIGDPIPLARPRMSNTHVWDSQKHLKFSWGVQLNLQQGNFPLFEGPLHLDVTFYFDIGKVTQKKRESFKTRHHHYVPDLSNLIKYVEDCAIGIIYKDDCLIAQITSKKLYSDTARTEFTVIELE